MMIMHIVLQNGKTDLHIFRLSHNSLNKLVFVNLSDCCTHSTSKAATKESTNNHLYRKRLHRLLACNVACVRTCGIHSVDPACETFSACRKIKVVQRELSAAVLSVLDQRVV